MSTTIHLSGVADALRAFEQLPRRVKFKHLRIALNAGAGVVRNQYASSVRKVTGLLSKSVGVKVVIPDSSYNSAHHGRPAYAVIGVKRKAGRFMRLNSKGNLKGYGAAQRALVAERKRLNAEGVLSPLQRERAASAAVSKQFSGAQYRNPSRYAHLAGPGRDGVSVLRAAAAQSMARAQARFSEKIAAGINNEANSLSRR